jgi:hypothetical protein
LHVVDEFTREALAVECQRRIDADHTVAAWTGWSESAGPRQRTCAVTTGPS